MAVEQDRGPEEASLPGEVPGQGRDPAGSRFGSGFVRHVRSGSVLGFYLNKMQRFYRPQ